MLMECQVPIYCLSYNNPARKQNIISRFKRVNLQVNIYPGVDVSDPRMSPCLQNPGITKSWSCAFGHLDMISHFASNSNEEIAIFMEDDVLINKHLPHLLPTIKSDFNHLKIDTLLLGYLINNHPQNFVGYSLMESPSKIFNYYRYPKDTWGTQMYALSKSRAQEIVTTYTDYAEKTLQDTSLTHFSADWLFTKGDNSACIYPLVAIEDSSSNYDHWGQANFHSSCYQYHYDGNVYI